MSPAFELSAPVSTRLAAEDRGEAVEVVEVGVEPVAAAVALTGPDDVARAGRAGAVGAPGARSWSP